ncbi:MAG: biotin/lipoyl-binding protein [Ardenticatenaceae bacterium]|nr:biotin/lipoyl-binding protein [Ardenticatenaceae bacterium]
MGFFRGGAWRTSIFILLGLLLTGCVVQSVTEPHTFDPDLEPTPVPTAVSVAKPIYTVARGTVSRLLTLSGRVVPAQETAVSFGLNGVVTAVFVANGDLVEAGDLLAELDTSAYLAELKLAESALTVAQARVTAVETRQANDRRRAEIALEQKQIQLDFAIAQAGGTPSATQQMAIDLLALDVELAQLDLDELNAGVDPALLAEVDQALLRLEEIEALIANAQIVAPVSGTVVRLLVAAGDNVVAGETAVALADLTQLEIESLVRDVDLREMVEGMAAETTFASQPGDTYNVTLAALPPPYGTAENLEETTARFAFNNPADLANFALGDRLVLELIVAQNDDALWLPPAAVRDFQGRNFVVIQEGDTQRRVDVQLGIEGDGRTEILEGVTEGDTIVGP